MQGLFLAASEFSHSLLSLFGSLPKLAEGRGKGELVANSLNFHLADFPVTFIMPESLQNEGDIMEGTSSPLIPSHVLLKKMPNGHSPGLERI